MRAADGPRRNRRIGGGDKRAGGSGLRRALSGLASVLRRLGDGLREQKTAEPRRQQATVKAPPEEAPRERPRLQAGGFIWVWGFAVALAAASFVLHLSVRFDTIQAGYALSRAQAEQRQLRLDQRELRLELATLKAPGRIEEQARDELGMVRPDHDRIIRLGSRGARLALRRGR